MAESKANPLFASLNQGGNVTKGLKKVTKDMKTKNRADRFVIIYECILLYTLFLYVFFI